MKQVQSQPASGRRTVLLLLSGALLLAFGWMLAGGSVEATAAETTAENAAVVAGKNITMAELEMEAAAQLEQLDLQRQQMEIQFQQQRTQALLQSLDALVDKRLLEIEATAAGLTPEQLVEREVTAKIAKVTPEDVDAFYAQLQQQRPQGLPPKEQIVTQIEAHLQQQNDEKARVDYMAAIRAKHNVEILLEEPRTEVAAVGPAKGPETAPVTIVEFSDFECPFCSRVVPTLDQITAKYGDQVRLVFRQFPLNSIHANAQKAAEASLCAADQGKFWEMHDAMFADQQKLTVADLKATAERIGVDGAKFGECLDSGTYEQRVKDDVKAGTLAGVSGTPALFVNGRVLSGAQPFEAIAKIIDEELARAERLAKAG
jgi:protein-disulfide isomerase